MNNQNYVITTDNTADLPEGYLREKGIGCTYLSYMLEGIEYTEGNLLPNPEFYQKMRNGALPTTAQVNPERARNFFEPYIKEGKDILHIAFSSGLSGSYNSTRLAAEELMEEYPERKIIVIDSLAASLGEGLMVEFVWRKKEEGASLEECADYAREIILHMGHVFTVEDLNHLWRGGRVSRATAILGTALNIKPMLIVDNEGHLINVGKVRGRKKSILTLISMMEERLGSYKDSLDTVFISHGDCLEDAQFLADKIREKYPIKTCVIDYVGATIGAHSGPGTLALFFMADHR